ncbi:MAG: succinate dehydrogenase assembly factor 2 [Aquimonas sp.]|nr:succinate dehydrogenase assembly factor 2 [Aquimonas sp.]
MSQPITPEDLRRWRWRSRRGMRELDRLFERYLDRAEQAPERFDRAAFEALLASEDDAVWRWFVGREQPADPQLAGIVADILGQPGD